jgi:hypothetical protein
MARRESLRMAGAAAPTASHLIEDRQWSQAIAGSTWLAPRSAADTIISYLAQAITAASCT